VRIAAARRWRVPLGNLARVVGRSKKLVRGFFGGGISPAIQRATVARERAVAVEPLKAQRPSPVVHLFTAVDVSCYSELMAGIRQKVAALGIRYLDFDDLAGFAPGLSGKVFGSCEAKRLGPEKLFDAIRAAGLRIRLEDDPEQTAKMARRIAENFNPRQAAQARVNNRNYPPNENDDLQGFKAPEQSSSRPCTPQHGDERGVIKPSTSRR
jgi:hypothetical protein